ncbi:hypothetical protein V7052_06620, partial [Bacillus wiedmannii]|uniref:hypothetical protein n=1 Tax=Bacillus wiedmannii TaxID=1890302 RepID=UPI003000CB00
KLNKNLHEWFQQEIRKLKYELTKAICDYNEEKILEIKTQLSFCYTTIQSKIGTEEEEVFFKYVRDTLIKYSYPIIAIETYMVDFKSAYFILNHKQKKVIEKGFKELSQYSNSRNIMLFIEEVINNYNKQKERNNDLAMQGYKQWRDKCLLAFKRRKFDVLLELLQARDEYVYMKSNDVKIYKKTNELFDQLIKCKDEKVLKIIFNIYGIYKVSFIKKSI